MTSPREDPPRWAPSSRVASALKIQERLKKKLELSNRFGPIRRLGAMDISYNRFSKEAVGVLLIFTFPDLHLVETTFSVGAMIFPYIPGFLAFREGPILLSAYEKARKIPDLILFDGHGCAHPRRFGIACQMGVLLEIPTIGCAKSVLVGEYRMPGQTQGCREDLLDNGERIGVVYRSQAGVKPIFISPGHRVDFPTSLEIVGRCVRTFRIPEPVRQAHLAANWYRERILGPGSRSR